MLTRPSVFAAAVSQRRLVPGDLMATGDSISAGAISTAGAGTWAGAAIATGIIYRTGPGAGFTDTTDTAANILIALGGNAPEADAVVGLAFRLRVINTVAFAHTFAAGTGVVSGTGTLSIAASNWRDYIVTVQNQMVPQILMANTTNASAAVTFVMAPGQTAIPFVGSNGQAGSLMDLIGATVTGTGISANTTVIGVTQGNGGVIGVTLSANATATNSNVALTFGPTVRFDSIGSGTL